MPVGFDYWIDKYYPDDGINQASNSANSTGYLEMVDDKPVETVTSGKVAGGSGSDSGLNSIVDVWNMMNAYNEGQTQMVNEFNAKEAQKNRDWQERMSRNAHQYEVEDLIKAGLNPVLSAGGQGAYVGSGAVASGQKAVADDTLSKAALMMFQNSLNSGSSVAAAAAGSGKFTMDQITKLLQSGIKGGLSMIPGLLWSLAKIFG